MGDFSKAAVTRILKNAAPKDMRVSERAKSVFIEVLTDHADQIAENAVKMARAAGKKTITEKHIQLATRLVFTKELPPEEEK